MKALRELAAAEGVRAMRAINVAVINPWFLGLFVGMAGVSVLAGGLAVARWGSAGAGWMLAGGLIYLLGGFGVTLVFNVPLNDALARGSVDHAEAEARWREYVARWTRWNHVRTAAGIVAAALFVVAAVRG